MQKTNRRLKKTSVVQIPKLPCIFKSDKENQLTRSILLTPHPNQSPFIDKQIAHLLKTSTNRYIKTESKHTVIQKYRQIAKSNYIKDYTQKASLELNRSRAESNHLLKERLLSHQQHEISLVSQTKKEQSQYLGLQRRIVRNRELKIQALQKLQSLAVYRQSAKDRSYELRETLKTYQGYHNFCFGLLGDSYGPQIVQVSPSVAFCLIRSVQDSCIEECERKKKLQGSILLTECSLRTFELKYEPVKSDLVQKRDRMKSKLNSLEEEVSSLNQRLQHIRLETRKRDPYRVLSDAVSKCYSKCSIKDLSEQNVFLQLLIKVQFKIEKYAREIEKYKDLNPGMYHKKEYQYLLDVLHPRSSLGTADKFIKL